MGKVITFLSGKKTYIMGAGGLLVVGLWMGGVISDDIATQALAALGFGGIITLRAAVSKGG